MAAGAAWFGIEFFENVAGGATEAQGGFRSYRLDVGRAAHAISAENLF